MTKDYINILRSKYGSVYTPPKYFNGLETFKEYEKRYKRILEGSKTSSKENSAYRKFNTDTKYIKKTKPSKYTVAFKKKYPNANGLKEKSKVTGVPYHILKKVYSKGVAAWRTGHRVGVVSKEAWGYARVHSFLTKGKTFYTTDKHLFEEAVQSMNIKNIKRWIE